MAPKAAASLSAAHWSEEAIVARDCRMSRISVADAERALGAYAVAFDCETDALFGQLGGERDHALRTRMNFTVTCACVIPLDAVLGPLSTEEAMKTAKSRSFWRDDNEGVSPVEGLLDLFDGAAAIVGFNHLAFDFPLLQRFYTNFGPARSREAGMRRYFAHRAKSLDLMTRVQEVTGVRHKLDSLLKQNGLAQKTASGVEAVRMWEQGRREELEEYCRVDTEQTLRLALLRGQMQCDGRPLPEETFGLRPFLAGRLWEAAFEELAAPPPAAP